MIITPALFCNLATGKTLMHLLRDYNFAHSCCKNLITNRKRGTHVRYYVGNGNAT